MYDFAVLEENPNVVSGSNGCLCSEVGDQDTKGPFIVFRNTETDNVRAPFPVLCAACVGQCASLLEALEPVAEAVVVPPTRSRKRANPHNGDTILEI